MRKFSPMPELIQSRDNPRVKRLRALIEQPAARKKHGRTVLEGAHLLEAFLQQGLQPEAVFSTANALQHAENQTALAQLSCPLYLLPESLYQSLSSLGPSTPLLAEITVPSATASWRGDCDTLVLDSIQDPGNVGTLLRSAAAVGVRQVLTTTGTANLWSPRVLRAGMGAHFSLALYEAVTSDEIWARLQVPVFATSSHQAQSIYHVDLRAPCAWVLGNEGAGVSDSLLAHAQAVAIPQPGGQESLNVAVAGSVCLFEMLRQRLA